MENVMIETIEFNGVTYDARHGGAFDRGAADSWYCRPREPHYFLGATYSTPEVRPAIHSEEYEAYLAGYDWNERFGGKKDWG